jgi:hypothetical protein
MNKRKPTTENAIKYIYNGKSIAKTEFESIKAKISIDCVNAQEYLLPTSGLTPEEKSFFNNEKKVNTKEYYAKETTRGHPYYKYCEFTAPQKTLYKITEIIKCGTK